MGWILLLLIALLGILITGPLGVLRAASEPD
jgi:hypothetical protein